MFRNLTRGYVVSYKVKNSISLWPLATSIIKSPERSGSVHSYRRISTIHDTINYRSVHNSQALHKKEKVDIVLRMSNGQHINAQGNEGDSILDVIVNNHIDIKGFGACEGTVSCSTCHVMFSPEHFERLNTMSVEEEDVLDMAEDVTPHSRLGCQVVLSKDISGLEVKVPEKVKDIRHAEEDDAVAK